MADQFVVNNGDDMKIGLVDGELKCSINDEIKKGEHKPYKKSTDKKYTAKVGINVGVVKFDFELQGETK